MLLRSFLLLALIAPILCLAQKKVQSSTPETASQLFANYWQTSLKLNPLDATADGVNTYNDQLPITISKSFQTQQEALDVLYLEKLRKLDTTQLTESEKLSAAILTYQLNTELLGLRAGFFERSSRPIDQFGSFATSFATLASGAGFIPFKTAKDYQNFLERLKQFPNWVDTAIANMQQALKKGNSNPRICMEKVPPQLISLLTLPVDSSVFYKPVLAMPTGISAADRQSIAASYKTVIAQVVLPSYKKLNDYIQQQYIPQARTSNGLIDNYRGKEEYAYWIHYWTTTDMSADAIFDLGQREVKRIRSEMDSLRQAVGFTGDLKAFFAYVKTDPKFFPFTTETQILDRYRSFYARMEPKLKAMFHLVPKAAFEVRAVEKFRAKGTNAQYNSPAKDGSRPGIFYEVIIDPRKYNYIDMEDLFLHEAIPGHHYQLSLQQEMPLPDFQRNIGFGAYAEGWGLYAESLGKELGMYTDPYQYLGRLSADMERSIRLVVDVGLHHKGWTRQECIDFMLANQPISEATAIQRTERYMVFPGQALSYKIGEQKLIELRQRAQRQLGNKFDIRAFHDEILKDGSMPLSMLEQKINRWISQQ